MIHVGAKPVFCDIDDTYTIDPEDARKRITEQDRRHPPGPPLRPAGEPRRVQKLATDHGLWIIEDCAQSHGAKWKGKRAGSYTEHAAFSFYPSKNLTVYGDGGAIATQDDEIARKVTMLRNHGRKDKYLHEKVGYNLRFNEIQAAVGREQLKVLDDLNAGRRRAAEWYRRELAGVKGIDAPAGRTRTGETETVYHMFVIRLDNNDIREGLGKAPEGKGHRDRRPLPRPQPPAAGHHRAVRQAAHAAEDRRLRAAHPEPADVPGADRSRK